MRVLIVDDDPAVVDSLCGLVDLLGHEATGVTTGREALERFRRGRYDVVVVDLLMPPMNGLEVIRRLRTISRDVRIVALTGTDLDVADVLAADGVRLVRKPILTAADAAELIASAGPPEP
jgi:CheY-like chemotaxis protein